MVMIGSACCSFGFGWLINCHPAVAIGFGQDGFTFTLPDQKPRIETSLDSTRTKPCALNHA